MIDEEGRLRRIDYSDRIYFDSGRGIAGTTYPIGTAEMPSDVIADIITICTARNIHKIAVEGALTLGAAMQHYCFGGNYHESIADTLDLNSKDVDNSRFERLVITGAQAGAGNATFIDCLLYNMSGFRGMAKRCAIFGTLAVATGNTDYADFDHCTSIHGNITVTIASPDRVSFKDFSGGMILTAQAAGAVLVRGLKGYLEVDLMTGGTLDIYADAADIQINNDCTVGTINIYGNARVVNNTGGTIVNDYTLEGRTKGQDDIHDDLGTHDTALGTHDTDIKNVLTTIDNEVGAIETKLDTPANFMADVTALALEATLAAVNGIVDNIILDAQVRSITSDGKAITGGGAAKWLNIDSGTNGAEILAIILNNYVGQDWTVDTYVPYVDAVAAPAAIDKRDTFSIINTDTEGGLLKPTAIAFNMLLDFTNDAGAGDDTMTVTVVYRSRGVLTLTWEA